MVAYKWSKIGQGDFKGPQGVFEGMGVFIVSIVVMMVSFVPNRSNYIP